MKINKLSSRSSCSSQHRWQIFSIFVQSRKRSIWREKDFSNTKEFVWRSVFQWQSIESKTRIFFALKRKKAARHNQNPSTNNLHRRRFSSYQRSNFFFSPIPIENRKTTCSKEFPINVTMFKDTPTVSTKRTLLIVHWIKGKSKEFQRLKKCFA